MREVRATAAAVVLLFVVAASASGQCVSSVKTLSARGDTPRFLAGPTAWSGRILAVAGTELDREEFQILLYDEQGTPLAPNEKIRSSGANLLDVLWTGTEFGVFSITDGRVLGLTRVGTDGKVVGPRVLEISGIRLAADDRAEIAWVSHLDAYLIAHTERVEGKRTIRVATVRSDGKFVRETLISAARDNSFVHMAVTATGTIGIFFEDDPAGDVTFVAFDGTTKSRPVAVWTAGDDILVTARNDSFALLRPIVRSGDRVLRWMTVDTSGQVRRQDSLLSVEAVGDVEPVFFLGRDPEYALSYLDWPEGLGRGEPIYRLARFGPDEEPVSDTYFSAAAGTRRRRERTDFPFEWTGSSYVSLASDENGDDNDTFLLRLCPLRTAISAPRSARPSELVTLTATADGGVPGYTYSWSWNGGSATGPVVQTRFPSFGVEEIVVTVRDTTGTTASHSFLLTINLPRRRPVRK